MTLKKQKNIGSNTDKRQKISTISYTDSLYESLKDLDFACGYLTSCYEEGLDVFLLGIKDVVEANGGIGTLAKKTSLNRENLYDMLSEDGNPRLSSLSAILNNIGIDVSFKTKQPRKKAA